MYSNYPGRVYIVNLVTTVECYMYWCMYSSIDLHGRVDLHVYRTAVLVLQFEW
jgi:hypothetical protein